MDRLLVVADDREQRSPVYKLLQSSEHFNIQTRRLPLGDYLIGETLLVERKTLPDLAVSLCDGRLFSQAVRLANSDVPRLALVLEGTGRDLQNSGLRREAIQGALLHIGLFIGLTVLRSHSPQETVQLFRYAALQGLSAARGSLPRAGRRPKDKAALQHYILQGLPGIGPERARRLLEHFGSVEAVLAAKPEALQRLPGIGRHVAQAMRWAVSEPSRAPYATFLTQFDAAQPEYRSIPYGVKQRGEGFQSG